MQGTITKIKDSYGFILIDNESQVFFHLSTWLSKRPPILGDEVEFDLAPSHKPQFKEHAIKVRRIRKEPDAANILAGLGGAVKS